MEIEISNLTDEKIDENILTNVVNATSKKLGVKNALVSITLIDNKRIHEINKEYRGVDRETDVISFAFMEDETDPIMDLENLGEIYISLERAHEQAKEYGHSFLRELSFLTCHGLLHLLGYDHMTKEEEKEMFSLQEEILSSINVNR